MASKITIPAVKINGMSAPSFSINDPIQPDACVSIDTDSVLSVEPEDISFLEALDDEIILPPALDEEEAELGDFLLEAVEWL